MKINEENDYTFKEFREDIRELVCDLGEIRYKEDSSLEESDILANFRRHHVYGTFIRLSDKFHYLKDFMKTNTFNVKDESFIHSFHDIINYAFYLMILYEHKYFSQSGEYTIDSLEYDISIYLEQLLDVVDSSTEYPFEIIKKTNTQIYIKAIEDDLIHIEGWHKVKSFEGKLHNNEALQNIFNCYIKVTLVKILIVYFYMIKFNGHANEEFFSRCKKKTFYIAATLKEPGKSPSSFEGMLENVATYSVLAKNLREVFPDYTFFSPHEHKKMFNLLWLDNKIDFKQILNLCCDVVKLCDIILIFENPKKSPNVLKEIETAYRNRCKVLFLYDKTFTEAIQIIKEHTR